MTPEALKTAPTDPAMLREWLRERIAGAGQAGGDTRPVATGWGGVGDCVGSLRRGVVHEWFGLFNDGENLGESRHRSEWVPPLLILSHLVRQAASAGADIPWSVWIGRRVWPTLHSLLGDGISHAPALLSRAVLVDPRSPSERLWAIDAALRVSGDSDGTRSVVVVGDGSALDMAGSRRLQLAAESGGALGLIARPPWELSRLSAASARWCVSRMVSSSGLIAWRVRLVRGKGMHTMVPHEAAALTVERSDVGAIVRASPDLGNRSGRAPAVAC